MQDLIYFFSMIRNYLKSMYIPAVTIITVVLILFIILVVSTYRNMNRQRDDMELALLNKGRFVYSAVEALLGERLLNGEGFPGEVPKVLGRLAEDEDVLRIMLIDPSGSVLFQSTPEVSAPPIDYESIFEELRVEGEVLYPEPNNEFIEIGRVLSGHGIIVRLNMKWLNEARRNDLTHAIFMGIMLLALGTASIYFVFVVQNYYLVDRTLERMKSYTENVVESMLDALVSVDPYGAVVTCNSAANTLLAGGSGSLKGKSIKEIVSPDECRVFDDLEKRGFALEVEANAMVEGGQREVPISISASRVRDSQNNDLGTVFIMRDIRDMKALQERVVRSEKLAVAGTLASGIAHEIRNPLSSIRGFAHYFKKSFEEGTREKEYLELMIGEIDRLNRTINDLLSLARPKEPDFRRGNISRAIEKAISVVSEKAQESDVAIGISTVEEIPEFEFDSDQVQQLLLNLLLNAIEATPVGGEIEIKAEHERRRGRAIVSISDTGTGVGKEEMSKIFDPFFTTREKGTGLGLAIVNQVVEMHGWEIGVESEKGKGTTFSIYIALPAEIANEEMNR